MTEVLAYRECLFSQASGSVLRDTRPKKRHAEVNLPMQGCSAGNPGGMEGRDGGFQAQATRSHEECQAVLSWNLK